MFSIIVCRNEVWRYKFYKGPWQAAKHALGRGLPFAIPLVVATIAIDKAFGITESRKRKQRAILMSYPGDHHKEYNNH